MAAALTAFSASYTFRTFSVRVSMSLAVASSEAVPHTLALRSDTEEWDVCTHR